MSLSPRLSRYTIIGIFSLIYGYLLIYVLIPFGLYDQLQSWDTPGHLFSAWFTRHYALPNYTGWNPFFYAGFPNNTFYPPLYHYLIALLSLLTGSLVWAFKIITALSVLSLPLSFYYFARQLKFQVLESSVITLLMMIPIVSMALHTGGTLYSLFFVGLGSNSLAMPLLFAYFGKLQGPADRKNLLICSVLMALIVLTHFVVAVAAAIGALISLGLRFDKAYGLHFIKHTLLSVALCSFWLIPFLAYQRYYGGAFFESPLFSFIALPVFLLCMLGLAVAIQDQDARFSHFVLLFALMTGMLVFVNLESLRVPVHPYRLTIYFLVIMMLVPVKLLFNQRPQSVRYLLSFLFAGLLGFHLYSISTKTYTSMQQTANQNVLYQHQADKMDYDQLDIGPLDGRVIAYHGEKVPHIHDLRHLLAMHSRNFFLKGLFVESAINGKYIASLHFNTVRGGFLWGVASSPMAKDKLLTFDAETLQKNMDLFHINYLLLKEPVRTLEPVRRIPIEKQADPYYLYQGESSLVELLPYQPLTQNPELTWEKQVQTWFQSSEPKILMRSTEVPTCVASASDRFRIVSQSPSQNHLKLEVEADCDVPILVKISEFSRWKAYVNGQKTPIYTVAPHLMLVYGKGQVELKYGQTLYDYLGWLCFLVGLFYSVYLGFKKTTVQIAS